MRGPRRIILIRHCESSGWEPDAPLTARGRRQAEDLADRLAALAVDALVSSPHVRARQSIEPFAAASGLDVRVDDRLVEKVLARHSIDGWRAAVRRSFSDPDWKLPGGESGSEAQRRGRAAVEAALSEAHGLCAVVTHGQLMTLVLRSIDARFGFHEWALLSNPDGYFVDQVAGDAWSVHRW